MPWFCSGMCWTMGCSTRSRIREAGIRLALTWADHLSRWETVVADQRRLPSIASLRFDSGAGNGFSGAYAIHCAACISCSRCHIRMAFRRYELWKIDKKKLLRNLICCAAHQNPSRSPDMFHQIILDGEVLLAYIAFVRLFTCKNVRFIVWIGFGYRVIGSPVWMRLCWVSVFDWLKDLSQMSHW